ncbi:hypothetical protein BV22DRAFT_1199852 [Leucogyrophana mollusca]|uniref:Uncharacterized protein n=1 Tax=Leucogyrophana mollusca TaxID=85980 RepID=A0ACB8AZL0_9AGAM|nr:hypothetical protein BV22DRAFT_1199852 [Leucogyrophana mollusca]
MNKANIEKLEELFPSPSPPPNHICPQRLPGSNLESDRVLQDILKKNHTDSHILRNEISYQNHISHHVLALYALGGSAPVLEAAYNEDNKKQRANFESPEVITEGNFSLHLGDHKYYQAYFNFFSAYVLENGAGAAMEEFVFSLKRNFDPENDPEGKEQPEMLYRFVMDGLLHPMIHVGYGVEFGLPGLVAEGLAMAALHRGRSSVVYPPSLFSSGMPEEIASTTPRLPDTAIGNIEGLATKHETHAFSVLSRLLKDEHFDPTKCNWPREYPDFMLVAGGLMRDYGEQWSIDLSRPGELERKIEELSWMNVLIYGVSAWKEERGLRADFILMHIVTSALFLPSLLSTLSPRSQAILLRAHFTASLVQWVMRGRPSFPIKTFFATTSTLPSTPSDSQPTPSAKALPSPTSPHAFTPNPWLPIIENALVHPDDHLCKLQRALVHFERVYGTRGPGYFAGTELEEAEYIDGSLFVRVAGMTAGQLGWVREGQEAREFTFDAFFDD